MTTENTEQDKSTEADGRVEVLVMPFHYQCKWCNYAGKDSEFISGSCPACCADNLTGEVDNEGIPTVFHIGL